VIFVNDTEKRRQKLLKQMRNLYQEDKMNPAVHPRYKAAYYQIYPENRREYKGTFGIRCFICILLFASYIMMGSEYRSVWGIDDLQVQEIIMHDYNFELY